MNLLPYKCEKCGNVFKSDPEKAKVKEGRNIIFCPYCGKKLRRL
jgi:DNA-directed RNA polymerase subunit RPC12/RpoP